MFFSWVFAVLVATAIGRGFLAQWFPLSTVEGITYTFMTALVILSLAAAGQYVRRGAYWEETRVVWRHVMLIGLINFAINFFVQVSYSRTVLVLAWCFVLVLIPAGRIAARELLIRAGLWKRKALVVGDGPNADSTIDAIRDERHMGLELAALMRIGSDTDDARALSLRVPIFQIHQGVERVAAELGCEVILVAFDDKTQSRTSEIVSGLHGERFDIFVVPALQGLPVQGMQAQYFFSNDVLFLRLQHRLFSPMARFMKRSIDIVFSLLALACFSPLMVWVAWRIWREDGGPVMYSQPRVGEGTRDFEFLKFRSMVRNADQQLADWPRTNPALHAEYVANNFKLANDPRVLKVGQFIRRRSIDELPQLINVLRGDMSLVGPRPLLRRELPSYPHDGMQLYLQVKPGITGLWQVSGRSTTTFAQRSALDSWYVRNWSLWVDWVILLKTVRVVLSAKGAI